MMRRVFRAVVCVMAMGIGQMAFAGGWGKELAMDFANPPKENHPEVWWWFDRTVPDAAITKDIEGMARAGIQVFHVYDINGGSAADSLWVRKVKWALNEADRLGLEGVICIGAAGCGHPDTSMESARKEAVVTTAKVTGGGVARAILPKQAVKRTPLNPDGSPKYYWEIACLAVPFSEGGNPEAGKIVDVSRFLDPVTDEFVWPDAPEGEWTICRASYLPNGVVEGYNGCFIDHLSKEAFDEHWGHAVLPLLNILNENERSALKGVMCDSWENGTVGWTQKFPEEFRARRGYDITPWLPALAGLTIGSAVQSERFIRDYNQTISELLAENHYEYQKEVAHKYGLISIAEAAGPHQWQADVRLLQGTCDVAMGEFWMPSNHRPLDPQRFMLRDAANAAHVYGVNEVLAEGFTTIGTYWTEYPRIMKPCADRAFCDGLTRVCYHGMYLSGSLTDKPGTIRTAGTHYNPQNTWFEQSSAFNLYLSRCSRMLSEGRFNADCLLYAGDAQKLFACLKTPSDALGEGYDYDFCPTDVLLQARVEHGDVVIPSGIHYKVIKLSARNPETAMNMKPGLKDTVAVYPPYHFPVGEAAMLKLRQLVEDGAVLLGERPEGPTAMTDDDAAFNAAADALWGGISDNGWCKVGKGYVFTDEAALLSWLEKKGVCKDFSAENSDGTPAEGIDWIHRTMPGADIYFVSNQNDRPVSLVCRFRKKARKAQLWNPVTGEITSCRRCARNRSSSAFAIELPSYGSVFVVTGSHAGLTKKLMAVSDIAISTPWNVTFDPAWGGPDSPVQMDTLKDWTTYEEEGIRYYSGKAVYKNVFTLPEDLSPDASISIDLGAVNNIAEVLVNGEACGIAWTEPFELVSSNLKPGENVLEVRVTNLWPNRLILDAGRPEEDRLTHTNINLYNPSDALLPSGLEGPVTLKLHK